MVRRLDETGRPRTTRVSDNVQLLGNRSCRYAQEGREGAEAAAHGRVAWRKPCPSKRFAPANSASRCSRRRSASAGGVEGAEIRVSHQLLRLLRVAALGQSQVDVDQLATAPPACPPRPTGRHADAPPMTQHQRPAFKKRPPRQQQVAVTAVAAWRIELIHPSLGAQSINQQRRLVVVVPRPPDVPVHLLQADQVWDSAAITPTTRSRR